MKRLLLPAALCVLPTVGASAQMADVVDTCAGITIPTGGPFRLFQNKNGVLCVTGGTGGSVTATTTATAAAGPTAVVAGTGQPLYIDLFSSLFTHPTYGPGTPVDSTHGLPSQIADGANVAQGTTTDTAWSGSGAGTVIAALKAIYTKLAGSVAVTGTFYQATQPVSLATAPTTPVTGTFYQTTQPISGNVSPQVNVGGTQTGQIGCGSSIVYDASTSGSTQLVALASGQKVYVCGYTIVAAGTVNVELDYGTGAACATGNVKITPAYQLTAQVGLVDGSPLYRGLATIASNALCLKTSAGVAVQAIVYYTQF